VFTYLFITSKTFCIASSLVLYSQPSAALVICSFIQHHTFTATFAILCVKN